MTEAALMANPAEASTSPAASVAPAKASMVLAALIVVAAVANLPLAMAYVALPSIGAYFDASQTQLKMVAVAYSLGLACSVLWLGALGDRYGRKLMLLLGVILAVPAALICAFAPTIQVLIGGQLILADVNPGVLQVLQKSGTLAVIGAENVFAATPRVLEAENQAWNCAEAWLAEHRQEKE